MDFKDKIKKYLNMNDKTRKDIVDWCKTWDCDRCQKCNVHFGDLEYQAQIKEEEEGIKRVLPVYTVDHEDNDSSHNDGYIDVDEHNQPLPFDKLEFAVKRIWHKFGNCRRLCWPCNRIEGIIKRKTTGTDRMTREKQDKINNEETFVDECKTQLNERQHFCLKGMINAGKSVCDSSPVTCERYLNGEIRTPENPKGEFRKFKFVCGGAFCNGTHISFHNTKPDVIIDEERRMLEREWEMQYSLPGNYENQEDAIRQWNFRDNNLGNKWISKADYVNTRLKLEW